MQRRPREKVARRTRPKPEAVKLREPSKPREPIRAPLVLALASQIEALWGA